MNDILVVCPSCKEKAIVTSPNGVSFRNMNESEIKMICTKCGYNKKLEEKKEDILSKSGSKIITGRVFLIGGKVDPYFYQPLWLTANCEGNTLYAYNYKYLEFLETHISAKLRERNTVNMANKSLGSRLPKWMTSTKNRETVLKAIKNLKIKAL